MNTKIYILASFLICVLALNFTQCSGERGKKTNKEQKITPLADNWEKAIPHQEPPKGLGSLSAQQCGACHQKHYEEWKMSTHSKAWVDLQFQSELKKESSPFMCINCHIPLQNQQEYIIEGLIDGDLYNPLKKKNPHFDRDLQQEGVTCASCHVRDGAIMGPTGTKKAPHKTVKNPEFLSETLCISCHNAVAVITPTLACTFETGDEWKAGPFYKEKNCISCHMEEVQREIVTGYGERKSHYHYFAGSGIPKFSNVETKMLNGLSIKPSKLKSSYSIKDQLKLSLKVKNEFAGHKVPTGNPERFFIFTFTLKDENGKEVDKQTERIGEEWEWYPEAKKLSDNNLLPGEERVYDFIHQLKNKGKYTIEVVVTKHRMNEETAKYNKLGSDYPLYIKIFDEEYSFVVK